MARNTTSSDRSGSGREASNGSRDRRPFARSRRELRETMESIAVAFILAFLFRTFEAEAFVIPTGSMAPTLFGRHKDVNCPQCGYHFEVGASDELERDTGQFLPGRRLKEAYCPNCRYAVDVRDLPVFTGDRILVNKFPYEIGDPARWDVFVFKYPEDPKTNYIKRLVGLPGETVEIRQGDLYRVRRDGTRDILRKDDPDKQRLLQILVYDHDYPARELHQHGWPERWAPVKQTGGEDGLAGLTLDEEGWKPLSGNQPDEGVGPGTRGFRIQPAGSRGERRWLRYRHIVPDDRAWQEFAQAARDGRQPAFSPQPTLISDYCAYNEYMSGTGSSDAHQDAYWVGDLTLTFQIDIDESAEDGELVMELTEGDRLYRCVLDVPRGQAAILHNVPQDKTGEEWVELASAASPLAGPGSYAVTFANVDDRLCVWVDDELIPFGEAAAYEPYAAHTSRSLVLQRPYDGDLIPAGIAARGLGATVTHLLLERDIYYRADRLTVKNESATRWPPTVEMAEESAAYQLQRLLHDPQAWFTRYVNELEGSALFELGPDEFLALGDNSPRSQDSRLWSNVRGASHRHAVPRSALVGKAFFIYWPHGVPFLNGGRGFPITYHSTGDSRSDYPSFRLPFYPNVDRMRRIR